MATKARILTCTTPKRNPTRAKTKAAKRSLTKKTPKSAKSNPTKPKAKAKKASKPKAKKNPSDLPTSSLKSRAKKAAREAAESAKEKAKRAGAATSSAAKAGAKKGAEVAKKAAKAGAAKGAELSKKAAVYTGEKLKQGGKRVGRKAAGVAKEAWSGIVKGWKENPTSSWGDGLKAQIDWIMGRVHVGTSDEEVRANIEKRCKKAGFDAKLTRRCSDYAIKAHRKNQQDYTDVMTGNFGPKRRKTKKNPTQSYPEAIPGEGLYSEYDEEFSAWGVFGLESGHCYSFFSSEKEADSHIKAIETSKRRKAKKNPTLYKKIASNPVPRAGGYIYRIAYETWDEEALEAGETDDKGWKVEESESYDTLEELLNSVSHDASWLEWSSSHPSSRDWIISESDQDYRSGDRTQYSLFIERSDGKPLTTAQLKMIDKKLRLRGTFGRAKPRSNPTPAMTKHFKARLAAAKSELKACRDGTWPRDTNDAMRYQHLPRMPHDPPGEVRKAHQQYVAKLLEREIDWLESKLRLRGTFGRAKPRSNPTPAMTKHFKARLAAAKSELKACRDGTWPRDTNDAVRYQHLPRMPHDPPGEVRKAHQQYVAKLLEREIDWLESKLRRDNPSQDQVHLSQKGKQWHVLLDKHWVPIADAEAKRQIESGEAVKVPWSHRAMNHHDRPDYIDPKQLGLMLQNWHYGQGDPVYAAGSSLFAGKSVPTEVLADALGRIRSLKTSSTSKHDKKGHKELVTIEKNLAYLVGSRKAREAGTKSNPVKKSVKFLAWTNAPAAYDYWYVKDTGTNFHGFRLVEVTDKERWEQFQVPRYESGNNVAFLASDKARVEQFGLKAKAKAKKNPVKKVSRQDLFKAHNVPELFELVTKHLGRRPTGEEFRAYVNTVLGPWDIPKSIQAKCAESEAVKTGVRDALASLDAKAKTVRSGGKVKARSITLTKLSGSKDVGKSVTLEGGNVWAKADRKLSLWAEPPAQEKVKFTVSYADAETYTGSYATKSGKESLAGHIRMTLDAVAAASPSQISETDRKKWQSFKSRYETGCSVCDNPAKGRKRNPTVTKLQVKKLLAQYKIPGQLSGKGSDWTLELPDEKAYKLWNRTAGKSVKVGGYRSGFGSWVLSPGYQSKGDPNDPSSRWHY